MQKWHFIYAYEQRYGGTFGVYDYLVLWCSPVAALEEAERLSREVIEKNGVDVFFHDEYYPEDYDYNLNIDIAYEVWELDDDAPIAAICTSEEEPRTLIEKYGRKLVWDR